MNVNEPELHVGGAAIMVRDAVWSSECSKTR